MKITMPDYVQRILAKLEAVNCDSYVVGGCVRDILLGNEPHDWDICTLATPAEVHAVFDGVDDYHVIDTGVQYGTVIVSSLQGHCEVTTFRFESNYTDGRRPDYVEFSRDIRQDLERRDFTINAMAMDIDGRIIDIFGGRHDLRTKTIRCVGDPNIRFAEDGLRILRAARFASTLGFSIEERTKQAMITNVSMLDNVSSERISTELRQILLGQNVLSVLLDYKEVIAHIIPELKPCIGFSQNNRFHCYDVYEHIAHAVDNYKGDDFVVKLTLLLHDIGKPSCYTENETGGHFYGHSERSSELTRQVMKRFHYGTRTEEQVAQLVLHHDTRIEPTLKSVRRWLVKFTSRNDCWYSVPSDNVLQFRRWLAIRRADILAHTPGTQDDRLAKVNEIEALLNEIVAQQMCFDRKSMKINGRDLLALGITDGKQIGVMLARLLDAVVDGELENDHDKLLEAAKKMIEEHV